ncbi:MAG TPA: aldehyde dehydrogenase family protein [Thermoplasmata archaeon]|nr:aldehyde dehydrogenase family protein [Thermoplasmata archaeon]
MVLPQYANFVDGAWDPEGEEVELHSPVDGEAIARIVKAGAEKANEAVESALHAFQTGWNHTPPATRRKLLLRLAERIQDRSEEYARLESLNTGKTLRQSTLLDVPLAIEHLRYFAAPSSFRFTRRIRHPEFPGTRGLVQYAPLGVVAAIAPWNVPLLMAVWKIAPAILAGNTVVLKPSHFTPLTAFELARDAKSVGFPDGVLNVVTGDGHVVGDALAKDDRVNLVSFTGSTATGKKLLRAAASSLKKVTLELGGKSPNIVFPDADLDKAAKGVVFGNYLNSGQLCESGSRLLVHESIQEAFLRRLREHLARMKPGNPMDMETDISAITTSEQLAKIEGMVQDGLDAGATLFYQRPVANEVPRGGSYYPPTLLTNLSLDMPVVQEEIFGPVLSVIPFADEAEAVQRANATAYGLACGIWTKDERKALRVASRMEAGTVWINDYHLLSAAAPRGGFKASGIGRELGYEGILECTQTRHLFVSAAEGSDLDEIAYGVVVR